MECGMYKKRIFVSDGEKNDMEAMDKLRHYLEKNKLEYCVSYGLNEGPELTRGRKDSNFNATVTWFE
jgi:hypothetical protein